MEAKLSSSTATDLKKTPETNQTLLKSSLFLYRRSFSKVFIFAFLLAIVVFIPRLIADALGYDYLANTSILHVSRIGIIAINIIASMLFIAIVWDIYCVSRHKAERLSEDIKVGAQRFIFVFIAAFIESAILFVIIAAFYGIQLILHYYHLLFRADFLHLLLTLLIFSGQFLLLLYISTLFYFFMPLIVLEKKGIVAALEKSAALVWNNWWRTISLQLTPWICYLIVLICIRNLLGVNVNIYFMNPLQYDYWSTIVNLVIFAFFIPWFGALLVVQLKDLELRKKMSGDIMVNE